MLGILHSTRISGNTSDQTNVPKTRYRTKRFVFDSWGVSGAISELLISAAIGRINPLTRLQRNCLMALTYCPIVIINYGP